MESRVEAHQPIHSWPSIPHHHRHIRTNPSLQPLPLGSEIRPFEFRTFWGSISNGSVFKWSGFSYGPHSKTGPFKIRTFFVWISNSFWQNGSHLFKFQMVGLPDIRSHSKYRPFTTHPLCDHSKSRLVQILDPHCFTSSIKHILINLQQARTPYNPTKGPLFNTHQTPHQDSANN